jgi:2-polyprenyl-3-methyl-5-hydroxy-6-metoxy-1,4-benzoquinol methylase
MILQHVMIKTGRGDCLLCDKKRGHKIHLPTVKKKTMRILDLGSGPEKYKTEAFFPKADVVATDFMKSTGVDVVNNFDRDGLPFKESQFDMAICWHVLEHMNDTVKIMDELHRVLKPDGIIFIRVPHFLSMGIWQDITHKKGFSYYTFDCLGSYSTRKFEILEKKLLFFHLNSRRKKRYFLVDATGLGIQKLANKFPAIYERILGYYFGGMDEILLKIRVVK